MHRLIRTGLVFAVFLLATAGVGLGQSTPGGPLPFNPQTVATVKGVVVAAPVIKKDSIPEMIHFTLKTDRESLTVVLGPNWFMARQNWQLALLDRLEVKGSRLLLEGKPALVAQEVKKGPQVMNFRDDQGAPLWSSGAKPAHLQK